MKKAGPKPAKHPASSNPSHPDNLFHRREVDLEPERDLEPRTDEMLELMAKQRAKLAADVKQSSQPLPDSQVTEVVKMLEGFNKTQLQKVYEAVGELLAGSRKSEMGSLSFVSPKPKAVLHKHVNPTQKRPASVKPTISPTHPAPRFFPHPSNELTLRILSTWSPQDLVGLTEIELFNLSDQKIQLSLNMIQVRNAGGGGLTNPSRLLNGVYHTVDEKNMWIASIPKSSALIEIIIFYPDEERLKDIRIWNYNGGLLELGKGVKDCILLLNGTVLWQGELRKGCGNKLEDYSTVISLLKSPSPQPEQVTQFTLEEVPKAKHMAKSISLADHMNFKPMEPTEAGPRSFGKPLGDPKSERMRRIATRPALNSILQSKIDSLKPSPSMHPTSLCIPELTSGSTLTILIHSTWGDLNYVGLCGVEVFDIKGRLVQFENYKGNISANPPDVNVLKKGPGDDPRTVDKLLDGVNWTCDDFHVWLAPFTAGVANEINIRLDRKTAISLVRIWNYNKSRIHSYRGARLITLLVDSRPVFKGEIAKAPGRMKRAEQYCEYILFTTDTAVLQLIEQSDWVPGFALVHHEDLTAEQWSTAVVTTRPSTATKEQWSDERPVTRAISKEDFKIERPGVVGKKVKIELLQTWGDAYYVGLTGIEVLDDHGYAYPLKAEWLFASPKDLNSIQGYSGDYRTVDKLINGTNVTTLDKNMWLTVFRSGTGKDNVLVVTFPAPVKITGIRLWNYNKSKEDTARGVKTIRVLIDDRLVVHPAGVPVRRAPGVGTMDFGQLIPIPQKERVFGEESLAQKWAHDVVYQGYITPMLPSGFTLRLLLLSTWGDIHYIGLTGLEVFDPHNQSLTAALSPKVRAEPSSINVLEGVHSDPRTVDKLIDGFNEDADETHQWLAPFQSQALGQTGIQSQANEIVLVFDRVVSVACVMLWNYGKTPSRGVKDFAIYLDETLLYIGVARESLTGPTPTVVMFTGEENMVKEHGQYVYAEVGRPKVKLYNEKQLLSEGHDTTFDVVSDRPTTSVNQS